MKIYKGITFLFTAALSITNTINAQTAEEIVIQNTAVEELLEFSEEWRVKDSIDLAKALIEAKKNNWPIEIETESGYMRLVGLHENGAPKYNTTNNRNAAKTISTDKVHGNGGQGFNLEGQNMIVGEWDGGGVRHTHQEFGNRVLRRDVPTGTNRHATHVAGTLVASGVRGSAKGMAPKATLWAYDWDSDASEMSTAASQGLLVSNHSYGTAAGWSNSTGSWVWWGNASVNSFEDYQFGFYDNRARAWDRMARLAPYYLIVKAAGNDRNDSYSGTHRFWNGSSWATSSAARKKDGDYDCIPTYATAKNILTVGAVGDLTNGWSNPNGVAMTNFSGWGPTDDGRIKPDIVGNGLQVYSTTNNSNTSYGNSNGTSMASPNVAGSCILLQQHYKAENGSYMRAATLKGLVIHTADEAGSTAGPDYKFGWGLMNTLKAARAISSSSTTIEELTLNNGGKNERLLFSNGSTPVKITICWTDVEGSVHTPALNNRLIKLVNDLDVRLVNANNNATYYPYRLNPLIPTAGATKGDNIRDNVEHIYYPTLPAGNYYLRITHKGFLSGGSQNFSLIYEGFVDGPRADFSASKTSICAGDTVYFTDKSTGNVNAWQWTFSGAITSGSTQRNPMAVFNNPGTFSVTLRALSGALSDTKTINIKVNDFPNAAVVDKDTVYCQSEKDEVVLTPVEANGTWNGGTWMLFINNCKFRPSRLTAGDYVAVHTLINQFGCTDVDSVVVKIRENPVPTLSLQKTDYCEDESAFTLTGGTPSGGLYLINGGPNARFDPGKLTIGSHRIGYEYTDTNGCKGATESYVWVENCVGIDEVLNESDINVFPNPFAQKVMLRSNSEFDVTKITTVSGKVVQVDKREGDNQLELDFNELSKGVYLVEVNANGVKSILRLIKK